MNKNFEVPQHLEAIMPLPCFNGIVSDSSLLMLIWIQQVKRCCMIPIDHRTIGIFYQGDVGVWNLSCIQVQCGIWPLWLDVNFPVQSLWIHWPANLLFDLGFTHENLYFRLFSFIVHSFPLFLKVINLDPCWSNPLNRIKEKCPWTNWFQKTSQ